MKHKGKKGWKKINKASLNGRTTSGSVIYMESLKGAGTEKYLKIGNFWWQTVMGIQVIWICSNSLYFHDFKYILFSEYGN